MQKVERRAFLQLAAAVSSMVLGGCADAGQRQSGHAGSTGKTGGTGGKGPTGSSTGSGTTSTGGPQAGPYRVGVSSYEGAALRAAAVHAAIELAGGIPWLKTGDTVLVKVAHNSHNAYPATASPVACAELVGLLLEAGASKVYVADLMGIDQTMVPGVWTLEDPLGSGFDPTTDGTLRAFRASGLYGAIESKVGTGELGPSGRVHITSFREDGWSRYESAADTPASPRLSASWVRSQLHDGKHWDGTPALEPYTPRLFDIGGETPGMHVPNLVSSLDHIVNLHRISTHVMSLFTLAIKNWVGIMRPDDRLWMHQIGYLKNRRGMGADPIRSEPPYNEILPELHASTWRRERLMLADASDIIASGGPDETDKDLYPANLVVAANDLISAEVVGLAILRMAVLASQVSGGLGGQCNAVPQSSASLATAFLGGRIIPWHPASAYGTDAKLCNPTFSPWDWIAVQRAREMQIGCPSPAELDLHFATDPTFAVPGEQQDFIRHDATLPPTT